MNISKTLERILNNQVRIGICAFLLATLVVAILTGFWYSYSNLIFPNTRWGLYDAKFWESVLVEAHGMLLDILFISVFILWLYKKGEKQLEIKRYCEEIDDYRGWESEEAARRIRGNIIRLNNLGKTDINLFCCYLKAADLKRVNLRGAKLTDANLQAANFWMADLRDTKLWSVNLQEAQLSEAKLENADLWRANLKGIRRLNSVMLAKVKTLYEAELDPALLEQIKIEYPDLLQAPTDLQNREIERMIEGYSHG